ncbi:PAS domain S-box protein [candidate division KSB1 bacterium]|nr:PAS domain S-box protein [candidate division KSB1 bacterium]
MEENESGNWSYRLLAGDISQLIVDPLTVDIENITWDDFIHPEDKPLVIRYRDDLLNEGTAIVEYRIITPNGQMRWIRDYMCLPKETTKSKVKILGIMQDVTQQQMLDEEVQKRAKLYERLIETSRDGISLLDLDGNIIFCNQQKARMLGYDSPDELIGKSGFFLIVPEERDRAIEALQKVLTKETFKSMEFKVLKKDGSHLEAEFNVVLIEDSDGNPLHLMDVIRDNTARKQAQLALLETEERFRKAFHLSTDAMCINRLKDGIVIEVNEAFLFSSGYSREEIIGHSILEFGIFKNSDDMKHFMKLLLKHQRVNNFEAQFKTKAGDIKIGLISANQLLLSQEPHILSIVRDITNRKLYEESLRLVNEQLEQRVRERTAELELANRQLESFNYSVSHDLKAPLRGIDGFSYMLLEEYVERLDDQARDYLMRIRKNAQNMGHLIDALFKLSQISQQEINLKSVNLSALVAGIAEELKNQEFCRLFQFKIAKDVIARADERLIAIALQNIIDNAVKFTAKCEMSIIEFGVLKLDEISTYFVRDNGIGFNNRYRDKLFLPFQRLHSEKDFTGTGIGLSIVNRIITKHGGKIWAESAENIGTTFYFTLESNLLRKH